MATNTTNRIKVEDVSHLIDLIEQGKKRFRIRGAMSHYYIDLIDGNEGEDRDDRVFDIWHSIEGDEEQITVAEMYNAHSCEVAWALYNNILYTDE